MNLDSIWSAANDISRYLLGNKKEYRTVVLSSGEERFVLPVTPWRYQVQTAQDNKIFDILDTGEALIFGNPKLKRLKFGSFFPATKHNYPFVAGDIKETDTCIELLMKWKENKSPVRIIITDSPINLQMSIMDFNYNEKDGSLDIYYELTFTEYRDLNTPQANNTKVVDTLSGLKDRPTTDHTANDIAMFLSQAADILEMSKIVTGTFGTPETFMNAAGIKNYAARTVGNLAGSYVSNAIGGSFGSYAGNAISKGISTAISRW